MDNFVFACGAPKRINNDAYMVIGLIIVYLEIISVVYCQISIWHFRLFIHFSITQMQKTQMRGENTQIRHRFCMH